MLLIAAVLAATGIAAVAGAPWGALAAAIVTSAVVLAAFWVNYLLFGNMRLMHTATNLVVTAIILILLWAGRSGPSN
jgi:hypothetical protein